MQRLYRTTETQEIVHWLGADFYIYSENMTERMICSLCFFKLLFLSETNSHCTDSPNYRDKYKTLKRKLKFLLYVSRTPSF